MKRRRFLPFAAAAAATVAAASAHAQAPPRPFRIGITTIASPENTTTSKLMSDRLRELGHVEGKTFVLDVVYLAGKPEGYGDGARTLVGRGADVLLALGPEIALKAALQASGTVPVVMAAFDFDPAARGYVKSLARPEGRITGIFVQQIELAVKRAQLAKQAVPDLTAATIFWDDASRDQLQATEATARELGVELLSVNLQGRPYDYEAALAAVPPASRQMLLVPNSPVFFFDRARLGEFTLEHRLPAIFAWREWVLAGGLMSYGPAYDTMIRRITDYTDRLARGAKPAELPIEQPTRFELVINLKTAKALGLTLPPALLARADEVIE
ncbi:MAG: hypothetical protein E6G95_19545 [Alphaproteobacteria bacterium]|nr:MAG: hypothetical protein E6G95_19545 [Alphaproteobacteria bacterium]